jgi:hypothetical protein
MGRLTFETSLMRVKPLILKGLMTMKTPEELRDDHLDEATIKDLCWVHARLTEQLSRAKEADRIDDGFYKRRNVQIMIEKTLAAMGHYL